MKDLDFFYICSVSMETVAILHIPKSGAQLHMVVHIMV